MLVHPSHRTTKHSVYTGWVQRIKAQWEALLERPGTEAEAELLEEFRAAYDDLRATEPSIPSFDEIRRTFRGRSG